MVQKNLVTTTAKPAYSLQERILMGGGQGTGKTYDWLTIARACPKQKFYIIDPDDGVRSVWYPEFPELENLVYYFTPTWFTTDSETLKKGGPKSEILKDGSNRKNIFKAGVLDAWNLLKDKINPGDWVIVEHLHLIWDSVQEAFADEVFHKDIGEYFLEKRKALVGGAKQLAALEGWVDWPVINKMHNADFINKICYQNPGHVFLTTAISVGNVNPKEDSDIKAFYGDSTIRFDGQKKTPFKARTTLIKKQGGGRGKDRTYIANTFLKDRGREHLVDAEITDFYYDYLVGIASW